MIEGHLPEGQPWSKATAIADALARTDAKILVIADADVWCDTTRAVNAVAAGAQWAIPHDRVHRLNPTQTEAWIAGDTDYERSELAERPYTGHAGGGIVVLRRSLYEVCPLDPRFVGWGHEDDSWALALRTLVGAPWRGREDLVHLWHPPQDRLTRRVGSNESLALAARYRRARAHPARMRQLLEEVR